MNIRESALEHMRDRLATFGFPEEEEAELEARRQQFVKDFDREKIRNLQKEEYFPGMGLKMGCLAYELEWDTIELGSIKGGSKYKYSYEEDFERIKALLIDLTGFDGEDQEFYGEEGQLTPEMEEICDRSRDINGFKTGRTVLPKLLSIYYPEIFLPIFNDADRFLEKILVEYVPETTGLELYLHNNDQLSEIMERLDEITEKDVGSFSGYRVMELLYHCYPKESRDAEEGKRDAASELYDEPEFDALEVQHYQSLIHRNFNKLFPDLAYFEEDVQNPRSGQYDTQTVGIMDFLAVEKDSGDFVVIELKRRASDKTIGQLARYMGWVEDELCKQGQGVKGIILAEWGDIYLDFALKVFPDVEFRKMELDIHVVASR